MTQRFGSLYADYSRFVPRFIRRWRDRPPAKPKNSGHARGMDPSRRRAA